MEGFVAGFDDGNRLKIDGCTVGATAGFEAGLMEGWRLVGWADGLRLGGEVGINEGEDVGTDEGGTLGVEEGSELGFLVGSSGDKDGDWLGLLVGLSDGFRVS